jgi:hypothetical protein
MGVRNMSEYPIMLEGTRAGTLKVEQKGLLTVFDASVPDTGEMLRLSVYGEDGEGYLGVMRPENGVLRLVRRFSRAAMAQFPRVIDYAAPAGAEFTAGVPARGEEEPQQRQESGETAEECETVWFSAPDGSLSSFDGKRLLIALPTDNVSMPKGPRRAQAD